MNIHVANIGRTVIADDLREAFTRFGIVASVRLVKNFGFVEMPHKDEALNAIRALNGTELRRHKIRVTRAHTQPIATSSQQLTFSEPQIQALFGHEAAENEDPERLRQYYFKSSIYETITTDLPLRILVGHKGIGKSALFQVAIADDIDNNRLALLIKPDDIADFGSGTDFLTTIRSWKTGLNEIIARKVIAVLGIGSIDLSPLLQYSGRILSFFTETFKEPEKLSLDPTKQMLVHRFLSSSKIIVYIDDLDRGWEGRKEDVRRISALLNALRDISTENRGIYFKVSLRSDVYYLVRTSDESTDKIEGSVIWQSWNTHEILALLVKRIETFFGRTVEEADLVAMKSSGLAPYLSPVMEHQFLGRGHWQNAPMHRVLMSLIRKRPRDLVKLCTLAARNARATHNTVIRTANLESVFQEYSQGRLQDTINEFRSELPDLERLLMNMRPTKKERTAQEGYVYSTDSLLKKIRNIKETGAFKATNSVAATDKELAAFMYKINFLTARKETSGEIIRSYFEENRYLSNEFRDFGFHWEVHPAYRWVLQPESAYDIFNELELSAE